MAPPVLNDHQQAHVRELVDSLRPRLEPFLHDAASLLLANLDSPFGATEFALRDLLLHLGADLLETSLAQKKTATTARP